jgi:hypothetical protein
VEEMKGTKEDRLKAWTVYMVFAIKGGGKMDSVVKPKVDWVFSMFNFCLHDTSYSSFICSIFFYSIIFPSLL